MIVVDASAICAILLDEPEGPGFTSFLMQADGVVMSPVGFWEACVSIENKRDIDAKEAVNALLEQVGIDLASADGMVAFDAWRQFGKGRHPAGLNLGDCFAYALAASKGLPLLYKGDDFSKTDIRPAL